MSGALAERDFVDKLEKSGFTAIEIMGRRSWGVADCRLYPLFTDDLIGLMERLIPHEQRNHIAESIVIKARLR